MAVAAFIVSLVAVVVAAASALYARKVAKVEAERRHDEETPVFEGRFDYRRLPHRDEDSEVVAFTYLRGPGRLDEVRVRLVVNSEAVHPPLLHVGPTVGEVTSRTTVLEGPPAPGDERIVAVVRHPEEGGGTVPFELSCRRGRKRWDVVVYVEVPGVPRIIAFDWEGTR